MNKKLEMMKGVLKPITAGPSISHSHRNNRAFGKIFYAFDLYNGNMDVGDRTD